MEHSLSNRGRDRRGDPILATLVDVAIAYRDNLGTRVALAFMRETGVPEALAARVLDGTAAARATGPRRWTVRAVHDQAADRF